MLVPTFLAASVVACDDDDEDGTGSGPGPQAPAAVTVQVTTSVDTVTVTWTAEAAATAYRVELSTNPSTLTREVGSDARRPRVATGYSSRQGARALIALSLQRTV